VRPATTQARQSWWQRFRDPRERRARRDYRRSLPPFYRWRRVILTILLIALVLAGLYVAGRNPVGWGKGRYYDIRGSLVSMDPALYVAQPPQSKIEGFPPEALGSEAVDDAWATSWSEKSLAPVNGCAGQKAAPGMVRLVFEQPTRVRALDIAAGLPADNAQRQLFYNPKKMLVVYGANQCTPLDLRNVAELQRLELDTQEPVGSLTLAISEVYPGRTDGSAIPKSALSTVTVLVRPH
jgi:hypothetical protein